MWTALYLVLLVPILLCICSRLRLQHYYFQTLERVFAYTRRQLQEVHRSREREHQQLKLQPFRAKPRAHAPPAKDKLSARMEQCCDVLSAGLELVLEDEVTIRFAAPSPPHDEWNLLLRNLKEPHQLHLNWRLRLLWLCGLLVRYLVLVPVRILACTSSLIIMTLCTTVLGHLPSFPSKRYFIRLVLRQCMRMMASAIPIVSRFHNLEHRPTMGICVCNHTSPLDVLVLMCDVQYALTGQRHGGIMGLVQRALRRVSSHVWFERCALVEREALSTVLRMHVAHPSTHPMLLFPEGTCINNTAVMQFKKGSFAASSIMYPIAVRYDRRFGEAFWDSRRYSMLRYLWMVISSWSLLCDVWYLPPILRRPRESPIQFSSRVKGIIAAQAGIDDLPWDGNLKRMQRNRDW